MELGVGVVLFVFAVILAAKGVRIVRPHERALVERLGKYQRILEPGLNMVFPFIDTVVKVDMREQFIDVPSQHVISKDNASVEVDAFIYYQVTDPFKVTYNVRDFHQAAIWLAYTNLRNQIGEMTLEEALTSRERINLQLRQTLDEATEKWGVKVTRVEIKTIQPPKDITDAMSKQMKAERERRAVILEAEGVRQSQITRAEGEKEAAILQAQGKAEAIRQIAEAEKYQRLAMAEAEAEATRLVFHAIHEGHPTNELITLKYLEALSRIAQGQATKIFLPMEMSKIVGSLATLLEATKELKEVTPPLPPVEVQPAQPTPAALTSVPVPARRDQSAIQRE